MSRLINNIGIITILLVSCNTSPSEQVSNGSGVTPVALNFDMKDTIPQISVKDTSLAYPQIFEGSFKPGTIVKQLGTDITFDLVSAGNLKVSSGNIIADDPVALGQGIAFKDNFPIGEYPVELAMASIKMYDDKRVAFARIKFSDNAVQKWEFALLPGQSSLEINSRTPYGYGVDAGLGLFIDQDAKNDLVDILDKDWEKIFSKEFEYFSNYNFANKNAVFFSTGYGDGFYSTFIGKDNKGKICQLLTDFGIVMWWNVAR